MKKKSLKNGMLLISFAALIFLVVFYIKEILAGLGVFIDYCMPFIAGIIIAFFLNPLYSLFVKGLNKLNAPRKLSKFISTVLVFVIAFFVVRGIIVIVIPQVMENAGTFYSNFDNNMSSLQMKINEFTQRNNLQNLDLSQFYTMLQDMTDKLKFSFDDWGPKALSYVKTIISGVTGFVIALIFSVYVLNGRYMLIYQAGRLNRAIFPKKAADVLGHIGNVIIKTFDNYVVGQTIEAVILGLLCFAGMRALGFYYSGMISVVVAVTALIPVLGAWVGGAVGVLLNLLVNPMDALIFLIFFIILQQVENNFIYPKVVGKKLGVPGLWVMFAVLLGGKIGGFLGMFLGVPIFTVIYTLLKDLAQYKDEKRQEELLKAREAAFANDEFFKSYDEFYENKEEEKRGKKQVAISKKGKTAPVQKNNQPSAKRPEANRSEVNKPELSKPELKKPETAKPAAKENEGKKNALGTEEKSRVVEHEFTEPEKEEKEFTPEDIEEIKHDIYVNQNLDKLPNEAVFYVEDEDDEDDDEKGDDSLTAEEIRIRNLIKEKEAAEKERLERRQAFRRSRFYNQNKSDNN